MTKKNKGSKEYKNQALMRGGKTKSKKTRDSKTDKHNAITTVKPQRKKM